MAALGVGAMPNDAEVLVLRKAMDAQKSQAQSLIQSMLPPPPLSPGQGVSVDVYA